MASFLVPSPSGGCLRFGRILYAVAGGVDTRHPNASLAASYFVCRFEFLFSHIRALSFIPAFLSSNQRSIQAQGRAICLAGPRRGSHVQVCDLPCTLSFEGQFPAAFHQYFGGGFVVPEFRNWNELFSIAGSNSDMTQGMAQLRFNAPFYAGEIQETPDQCEDGR